VEFDAVEKTATLNVNGRIYTLRAEDELDRLLKQLGMSGAGSAKVNNIKAPMPGMILQLLVEAGQTIAKGDSLLILEAMKMENVIKSPGEGIIKHIAVKQGNAVEKNQIMIELH
jgi:biotin carboxyl carrier protein